MIRLTFFLAVILFASCNQKNKEEQKTAETTTAETKTERNDEQDVQNAKKWLVESIEGYFANYKQENSDYSSMTTKEYSEYKGDATSVGMDGGLSEADFKKKWAKRNTDKAGIGEAFLVGGQDFGKIKVSKCEFKNKSENGDYIFETVIEDTEFKSKYYREIAVQKSGTAFLINDVVEVKSEQTNQ